jgi:putative DNA primase/helicase
MPPRAINPEQRAAHAAELRSCRSHVVTDEEFKARVADYNRERGANLKKADAAGDADAGKTSAARKKILMIETGDLPKVAEILRDIIASSGEFFDRGVPVRITKKAGNKLPVASPLTTHGVVRAAHQLCRPIKDGESATLPDRVAAIYLDMVGDWQLPALVVISTAPILSDDGRIRSAEGYDTDTGVYCFNVPQLNVPEKPTRKEAEAGLLKLRQAFKTFPFSDAERKRDKTLGVDVVDHDKPIGHDESAFLNGLLTAVCRQSLWLTPGLLLNAPSISGAGTGKGLLVRSLSLIAYGDRPRPFTAGNDRHEMDKRLVAEVIEGNPVVFMDNVNGTLLKSNTLASFLTERPSGVRILGRSQMIRIELATFFALTGNGLSITEDLARRFIYAALDAQCEDPEQRPFGPGFLEGVEAHRAELLTAALTIWRWGRLNHQKAGITLGSFERWGKWVRDPLFALGCKDPVARLSEIKARDPERQRVIELFNVWWDHHGNTPVKASDLDPEVKEIADPSQHGRQYLARAIGNLAGTRQGGFLLERFGDLPNARKEGAKYRLLQIAPVGDEPKASASSASPATAEEYEANSAPCENEPGADELRMPPGDPEASAGHPQGIRVPAASENMQKIRGLTNGGADNADNADDLDKPATGQITARVWVREIRPPALGPPGDSLDDLIA